MQLLEAVIGLEVHAQMNTVSKMFCACDNDAFGKPPNTTVCPICMGHPGALPAPNKEAIRKAMQAAAVLQCTLSPNHHLDRKSYFYPDLPMGYQISQYDFPLAQQGKVRFGGRLCEITRLHIENDAGKLTHIGGRSYCDYNRAGTPLMEIVTEPQLKSPADAVAFAKELQRILRTVDASEADMEKGMMRFDASISLRPQGEEKLYPRSEIKNLNSFRSLEKALHFEYDRLQNLWEEGAPQKNEVTVHWDDDRQEGVIMRQKESAADYRYFPEPDVPPLEFSSAALASVLEEVGELPESREERYIANGLPKDQAQLLTNDPKLAAYYDSVEEGLNNPKRTSSIVLTQLLGYLRSEEKEIEDGPSANEIIALLAHVDDGVISANTAKEVLEEMVKSNLSAKDIIDQRGLRQIGDQAEIESFVQKAMEELPKAVEDFRSGNTKAKAAIIGSVMGKTKGLANPKLVNDLVEKLVQEG